MQIDSLGERMDKGFEELKELLRSYEERTRAVEQNQAGYQPVLIARMKTAEILLKEHSDEIKVLKNAVLELINTNRILKWVFGVFTAILVTMLIAIATGKAKVIFP
jgi:hypothetical protein